MDNYEVSKERAEQFFLRFDQEKIIKDWNLFYDECFLYTEFLGVSYRVCRSTGKVEKSVDGFETVIDAGFEEVLSIFDFFCHESEEKKISGVWAPVNSLKGRPRTVGVGTDFHQKVSKIFDQNTKLYEKICGSLGGEKVPYGDIGYRFSVFGPFSIIVKFYCSDEEFPAQTTILWDENTLQFIYYETSYYVAGYLLNLIADKMSQELT